MQSEDDLRAVSIIILLLHIYWFCYSLFIPLRLTHPVIDKILLGFNAKASLFVYPIYTKLFSILLLGLSLLGNKGVKHQKITLKKVAILFFIGASLFFLNSSLLKINSSLAASLYISSLSIGYILLLVSGAYISSLIKENNSTTKLKLRKVKFFNREHKREFEFITTLFPNKVGYDSCLIQTEMANRTYL
ncbi:YWFCY domain-containing protein [Myroides odoratimimus]|uniref:YWFCY domain-containing protein n=1 Tax=Myroides odoratimimus TaxID=76832 RepID=UPI0025752B4A|nr:YWFCY domain-containing protein [Myroides odoratimimus]